MSSGECRLNITDFEYVTPLWLYRSATAVQFRSGKADADYVVARPYTVHFKLDGDERVITVPQGMLTDLASVPAAARSLVGRVGPHLEASIVHDFLYIAWQDLPGVEARKDDRDFADELMRVAMIKAKVGWFKRTLIHSAVRLAGWFVYRGANPEPRYVVIP